MGASRDKGATREWGYFDRRKNEKGDTSICVQQTQICGREIAQMKLR
jgi:hypothetical protein